MLNFSATFARNTGANVYKLIRTLNIIEATTEAAFMAEMLFGLNGVRSITVKLIEPTLPAVRVSLADEALANVAAKHAQPVIRWEDQLVHRSRLMGRQVA